MNMASFLLAAYRRSVHFVLFAFFASLTQAYAENTYVIMGGGSSFTATLDGTAIANGSNVTIANALEAIRTDANGDPCSIQFGDGEELNIGSVYAEFDDATPAWGKVTLLGKINSSNGDYTVNVKGSVSIDSKADMKNTSTSTMIYTINHVSTGTLNIIEGTIASRANDNNSRAIRHNSAGPVNISGGHILSDGGYAIYKDGAGPIYITGGTIETKGGTGISHRNNSGAINISGGTVIGDNATAIQIFNSGLVSISESGVVTSNHPGTNSMGTIFLGTNAAQLEISGGTVENTSTASTARAISYDNSDSPRIKITGGTITTGGDNALQLLSTNQYGNGLTLTLGGNPNITGKIKFNAITNPAKVNVMSVITDGEDKFTPGQETYILDINGYTGAANVVAVTNGANFPNNFELSSTVSNSGLAASGKNLVATVFADNISTETELRAFAVEVNGGNDFSGKTVRLTSDIELTQNWVPIGKYSKPFRGIFNGQGHKISNLSVRGEYSLAGLFGSVENGAEIMDIGVEGADIEVNDPEDDEGTYAGILVGCANYEDEGTAIISNSYAIGKISSNDENDEMIFIGGLVGEAYGSLTITNSYAITELNGGSGDMILLGGLVGATGMDSDLEIEYSYAVSDMSEDAATWGNIGGILGYNMGTATVASVYYKSGVGAIGFGSLTGATALTDAELKTQAKFAGFDFENIWGIDEGTSSPYLLKFAVVPPTCPADHHLEGGMCVPDAVDPTCPAGQHHENGVCVPDVVVPPTCPADHHLEGDMCVPDATPIRSLPQLANQISVQTTGNAIMLGNLPGNAKIEMYNLQGKRVYSANSGSSQSLKILVQAKGVYVVKVNGKTFKVMLGR